MGHCSALMEGGSSSSAPLTQPWLGGVSGALALPLPQGVGSPECGVSQPLGEVTLAALMHVGVACSSSDALPPPGAE